VAFSSWLECGEDMWLPHRCLAKVSVPKASPRR
jgi:hypothetical protein